MSTLKLTNITKNNRYNALKRFIRHCQRSEIYRERISQTISFRTAWKARRRPSTSARSLTIVHLQALRRECRTRISATRQELEQSAHIIADPSITVPDLSCKSPAPFAFPPVQLKAAAHAFQVNRLSDDFRDAMPGLARTLRKPYGATGDIISRLYLTVDTIVPFMIMIGLPLCFNATGLVTLQRKNVRRGRGLLGDERVFVLGLKDRAGRRQRRSFPVDDADPFSISSLLEFVQKHADRLRDHVENRYSDCVFVAASRRGERPKGFFDENNDVLNCLKRALKQFLDTLKIPSFTINDLRVIGADVAALMSDGDIKVQQILLQHQSIATTRDHYQTEQAARARQEQLAHLMNERERLITSSSRIDPRNAGTKNGLYRAATPGFDCLDALNSPIKGQRPGTLCSAYGKCPRCPRAVLYPSTANAARLLQINERFEQARNVLNQTRWTIEWDLEHKMLREFWLLLIPKEVLTDARLLELPPVPLIE